jgi:uncharacterized protein YnzC (UPF0291/DUF896 family)
MRVRRRLKSALEAAKYVDEEGGDFDFGGEGSGM